jgi:hypothetical protein
MHGVSLLREVCVLFRLLVLLQSSVGAEVGTHDSGLHVAQLVDLVVCSAEQQTGRADTPLWTRAQAVVVFVVVQGVCMQAVAPFRQPQ